MRLLIVLLALVPLTVAAETMYITDNLRLGMHRQADASDRAFRTLESGQAVEVLARERNYAQVVLPDGVQGYVASAYLVLDKPARLVVAETQAESERLQQELSDIRASFAEPAKAMDALQAEAADLESQLDESNARVAELEGTNSAWEKRYEQYQGSLPFRWVAGAIAVCLIGGFLSGLWWVDHRSRRRHGGIRVY